MYISGIFSRGDLFALSGNASGKAACFSYIDDLAIKASVSCEDVVFVVK